MSQFYPIKCAIIMHCYENHKSHIQHDIKSLYRDYTQFQETPPYIHTATHQQKVTKLSYKTWPNCCPPHSIDTPHLCKMLHKVFFICNEVVEFHMIFFFLYLLIYFLGSLYRYPFFFSFNFMAIKFLSHL